MQIRAIVPIYQEENKRTEKPRSNKEHWHPNQSTIEVSRLLKTNSNPHSINFTHYKLHSNWLHTAIVSKKLKIRIISRFISQNRIHSIWFKTSVTQEPPCNSGQRILKFHTLVSVKKLRITVMNKHNIKISSHPCNIYN